MAHVHSISFRNDYEQLFGIPIYTMDRSERILTNDSNNEHAMIMTGLHENEVISIKK